MIVPLTDVIGFPGNRGTPVAENVVEVTEGDTDYYVAEL